MTNNKLNTGLLVGKGSDPQRLLARLLDYTAVCTHLDRPTLGLVASKMGSLLDDCDFDAGTLHISPTRISGSARHYCRHLPICAHNPVTGTEE
eukprot:2617969-Pyramimonas_sp.AAC.1